DALPGLGRRGRVGCRRCGAARRSADLEVAGGVGGADAVAIAVGGADAGVLVRGAGTCSAGDLGEVGAPGALAALDLVTGDAGVVVGGAPGQVDLATCDGVRGRRARLRRRLPVG